jgi:DNA polymerase
MRLVLDLETYYDDQYSLKRMHTLEYVRDERFLIHGAAVKIDDDPGATFYTAEALGSLLEELPAAEVELVCHNTYFDGLALYHHYQFVPGRYADTLSMARGLLPHAPSYELDYLCQLLGIGKKVPEVLDQTKGQRVLSPELFAQLGEYAKNDVELTLGLYSRLRPALPDDEMYLIHLTQTWGCRPVLHVDLPRAQQALEVAVNEREAKIAASGQSLETLSSQPKFVQVLEDLGVQVPVKTNKNGKEIPALARNDLGFKNMLAEYPEHRALFEGRLAAKSTLDVTRTQRIINIGSSGTLPMPLKYYGAHTGRWSGTDGLNPQNFRRGSELRKSIIAPPGYVILVADLAQIELRLNLWFCQELAWLALLYDGIDIYAASAANHFDVALEDVTYEQRFFGKTLELGLGYQMGWRKFRLTSALKGIDLTEEEAYQAVAKYRSSHRLLANKWQQLSNMLIRMYQDCRIEDGPVTFVNEGILLPNGMRLDYTGLTPHENGNWTYGKDHTFIYGGKMLENIIQALARIVMGEHLLAIERESITTVSTTHDEVITIVREAEAEAAEVKVREIMTTPPDWAPDLPLDVDTGWAKEYSK